MDAGRLHDLFEAHLERRLTPDDRAALDETLRSSREARVLFWEHVHQHAILCELLAEARGRTLAAEEVLADLCPPEKVPRRRTARRFALAAAVILFAIGLGAWLRPGLSPDDPEADTGSPLARLVDLRGDVFIVAERGRVAAFAGQIVRPGEEVGTGESSSVVVRYDDSSRLELNSETSVRLLEHDVVLDESSADKRVFLMKGALFANVAPGSSGRPMQFSTSQADLIAPRARFSSTSLLGETRIEMEAGSAHLARNGERRSIEIHTGTYAIAASESEVYRPAPMLPAGTEPAVVLADGSGPIHALAVLHDGPTLAYGCSNGQVKLWDVITRRQRGVIKSEHRRAISLAAAPDGRTLAVGYEPGKLPRDGITAVWDTRKLRRLHTFDGLRRVQAMSFTGDSRSLALVSGEKNPRGVLVWDRGDSRERLQLGDRVAPAVTLAVSPDGRTLAVGGRDGVIRLWDLNTGRPQGRLVGHTRDVQSLAFQPGGELLASGSRDGTIRFWSLADGQSIRTATGKFNEVRCLAFSPDGSTLASGHAGIALLWDVTSATQRTALRAHKFAITSLLYLPDGRTLATAGWDGTVKLWDLHPANVDRDP